MLTDTSMKIVLDMFFLALNNTDFQFRTKKLICRSYTTAEALPTNSRIEIIDKKEFAKTALDKNFETFMVYIAALEILIIMLIYPFWALQVQDNPILDILQ